MTGRGDIWATLAGAAAIILFVVNVVLVERDRSLQSEINLRQQFIQQSVQLEALNRDLISAIANLSVRNKDEQLKTILTQQGIQPPSMDGWTYHEAIANADWSRLWSW